MDKADKILAEVKKRAILFTGDNWLRIGRDGLREEDIESAMLIGVLVANEINMDLSFGELQKIKRKVE